ncbi:MAG TPA: DNA polymerase domain-containing protein [Candidatus Limnocylindria bacterium]|nr:DNA polymerase domain-containing protein [Candidatus Limnocylindria bacterium]
MPGSKSETRRVAGHEVIVSNPDKIFFPEIGVTKGDLVDYYMAVADGALRGVLDRPMALKRFVNGVTGEAFFQKRAPASVPEFVHTVELSFPSGRTADEVVVSNAAALVWVVNLGCIDLNPHPIRADDTDHPDELRVDLDPGPGVPWDDIRRVAFAAREVLTDHGLSGWPKTSGSRGIHVYARIERRWSYTEVRRAALALAREVERRAPKIATSKWWKEERHGVFLDYNQNAKDRTVASAYSVRPVPQAWVSAPLTWKELPDAELADFTVRTMPARFAELGDVGAGIDDAVGSLDALLELSARQEREGQGDAPWPPQYPKAAGEPPRVQPSRQRRPTQDYARAGNPSAPRGRAGSVAPARPSAPARREDGTVSPTGRRRSAHPLVVVSQAAAKEDAMAGLDRWRERHPGAAQHLAVDDVLVDGMRGRFTLWWRVRINLRHVPDELRPPQEPPDPDYDPWAEHEWPDRSRQPGRAPRRTGGSTG